MAGNSNLDMMLSLKECMDEVLNNYLKATKDKFNGEHSMYKILVGKIPQIMSGFDFLKTDRYKIEGSAGKGNWTKTPWIIIMDKKVTDTPQCGIYVIYLFSDDMETLYLTLNQGSERLRTKYGTPETRKILVSKAQEIRQQFDANGFNTDDNIRLGNDLYEAGCIFYKEYRNNNIPNDDTLREDLRKMIEIYAKVAEKYGQVPQQNATAEVATDCDELPSVSEQNKDDNVNISSEVERIWKYIKSRGFKYDLNTIKNFYISLKTKPFVILAGVSGTGKSKLVKLFAEAIGATTDNGRFKLVPVKPDWSDATDLLGYRDLHGTFCPGVLIDFVKRAMEDKTKPYFLCLDEMNLARVEYYFSDVLSIMETRRIDNKEIKTEKLIQKEFFGGDVNSKKEYKDLYIPENLYIIGTVNMDETTFPFSKKVLDRANTIEFSDVDLSINSDDEQTDVQIVDLPNDFLKSNFIVLDDCLKADKEGIINKTIAELVKINSLLKEASLQFGYRLRDEICFYMVNSISNSLLDFNTAMDYEILQKILPRIQGSSMSIKKALVKLFKICTNVGDGDLNYEDLLADKLIGYIDDSNSVISYPMSANKIVFMIKRFEEDGFTSYWM